MPIPKPRPSEEQSDFIGRCMGNDTMIDEYPEQKQRSAVCHNVWRQKDKQSRVRAALAQPSRLLRSQPVYGIRSATPIDPEGGEYHAGLIQGAAVITRGLADTQDVWIDTVMLEQTAKAINDQRMGTKSRFTHPELSGDGLGRALGRYRNAAVDGDIVRADLHLFKSAHKTPDGDLAGYVLELAQEDPEAFGNSIAFDTDRDAASGFVDEHMVGGEFKSPDDDNAQNHPHARLRSLEAVDVVDSPAANPSGLFHRGDELVYGGRLLMRYALGLSDDVPQGYFGVNPERVKEFVTRFLVDNGLCIVPRWEKSRWDREKTVARHVKPG